MFTAFQRYVGDGGAYLSGQLGEGTGERGEYGGVVWWWEQDDRQIQAQLAEFSRRFHDRPDIAAGGQPHMAGQHDLLRITPDVQAVPVQHIALARELRGRAADKVPVLREPRGGAQRAALAAAADADRGVRLLHGLGLRARAGELVVPTGEIRRLVREQADDDLTRFLGQQ